MAPYLAQLNGLDYWHTKEIVWDNNSDSVDVKAAAGHMLSARTMVKASQWLHAWRRALPAVYFNGSRYDLQLIKPYLAEVYRASPDLSRDEDMEEADVEGRIMLCVGSLPCHGAHQGDVGPVQTLLLPAWLALASCMWLWAIGPWGKPSERHWPP